MYRKLSPSLTKKGSREPMSPAAAKTNGSPSSPPADPRSLSAHAVATSASEVATATRPSAFREDFVSIVQPRWGRGVVGAMDTDDSQDFKPVGVPLGR